MGLRFSGWVVDAELNNHRSGQGKFDYLPLASGTINVAGEFFGKGMFLLDATCGTGFVTGSNSSITEKQELWVTTWRTPRKPLTGEEWISAGVAIL
jgi:hypothetical protein